MQLISIKEVMLMTSLGRSTIYRYINQDRFPKQLTLGEKKSAWVEEEVLDWIAAKIKMRNNELNI